MITPLDVYLIQRLDTLSIVFQIITYGAGISVAFGYFLFYTDLSYHMEEEEKPPFKKKLFYCLITFIFFGTLAIFCPNTNDVYKAIAIPAIVNTGQKIITPDVIDSTSKFVKSYMEKQHG